MVDLIKEYVSKRVDLLQLEATEKSVNILGTVTYFILLLFAGLFFTLLLLLGLGFLLGTYLNNYGYGFLLIAAVFLLVMIIVMISRKAIKSKIAGKILKSFND